MLSMVLAAAPVEAAPPPACRFMAVPASAGDVIVPALTTTAPCSQDEPRRRLRYDRAAKVARAAVDLAPGDELGRVFLPEPPQVLPGDRLAVAASIGPVTVAREVTALQAGTSGRWLFVRDDAGKVFKAPLPALKSDEENTR